MPDDFDAELVAALRTLERDPLDDGRGAVGRRVRRRRAIGVGGALAAALVVVVGVAAVVARQDDGPQHLTVGPSGQSGPAAPPLSAAATGVLTWPTTLAPGDDFSAVLRNPLSSPNTSCFLAVRVERWDGNAWGAPRDLPAEGLDPNLDGTGADCHPDLIQPGAFIGERKFSVPRDLAPGDYRVVESSTEGEGRLTVIGPNANYASVPPPSSRHSIDLAPGGGLDPAPAVRVTLDRVALLDDDRLAISWHSYCNVPGLRVDFDYTADRVTARLVAGGFMVTDCVGEPDLWSTVVDLPAPLWGRPVDVVTHDNQKEAKRVEVSPRRNFVLPEAAPGSATSPVFSTSIFRQTRTNDSTEIQVYGGRCIADAQSAVYADADNTIYVQPYVYAPDNVSGSCGPWQSFDIPVWFSPDGHQFFGPPIQ